MEFDYNFIFGFLIEHNIVLATRAIAHNSFMLNIKLTLFSAMVIIYKMFRFRTNRN